jgi:hypothetical protein
MWIGESYKETVENDGTSFSVEKKGDEFIIRGSFVPLMTVALKRQR